MLSSQLTPFVWRSLAASIAALATLLVMLVPVPMAFADECTPTTTPDGVVIPCNEDGNGGGDGGGDPGGGGGGPQVCRDLDEIVPCSTEYGVWNGDCYVRNASPQPPAGDPAWEGHEPGDGVVLECTSPECVEAGGDVTTCEGHSYHWSANPAPQVGPTAEELAQEAVAAMNLSTGQPGSTPPSSTGASSSVGAIGLPIWLWIANPGLNTTGPITITNPPQPGAGLSVTATGTLDRVEWILTAENGATVGAISCDGPNAAGTPYDGRNSAEPSPTCGFGADLNSSAGNLTLTGTSHWVVEWQSTNGESGQILFAAEPNSTQIQIGELQAIVRN